jgi:hypothetical protein
MIRVGSELLGVVRAFAYGAAGTAGALAVVGLVSAYAYRSARKSLRAKTTDKLRKMADMMKGKSDA